MHVNDRTPLATSEFKRHAHTLTSFQAILAQDWPKDHLQIPPEGILALRNPDYVKYAKNEGQAWLKHIVHEFQQAPDLYTSIWELVESSTAYIAARRAALSRFQSPGLPPNGTHVLALGDSPTAYHAA